MISWQKEKSSTLHEREYDLIKISFSINTINSKCIVPFSIRGRPFKCVWYLFSSFLYANYNTHRDEINENKLFSSNNFKALFNRKFFLLIIASK